MRGSFDVYSEHALNLIETREGHGTLLLTASLRTLFCDSRAHKLCGEIQHGKGQDDTDTLSVALVKVCEEIKDLVPLRNHSKDWEEFAVKRVIRGRGCQIFVCGIGLPAGLVEGDKPFAPRLGAPYNVFNVRGRFLESSSPMIFGALRHCCLSERKVPGSHSLILKPPTAEDDLSTAAQGIDREKDLIPT